MAIFAYTILVKHIITRIGDCSIQMLLSMRWSMDFHLQNRNWPSLQWLPSMVYISSLLISRIVSHLCKHPGRKCLISMTVMSFTLQIFLRIKIFTSRTVIVPSSIMIQMCWIFIMWTVMNLNLNETNDTIPI